MHVDENFEHNKKKFSKVTITQMPLQGSWPFFLAFCKNGLAQLWLI